MPACVARSTERRGARVSVRAQLATPLLLVALTTSVHGDPLFSAPFLSFDVGINPRSVAIADLDADGRRDLVVASDNSNAVSVLEPRFHPKSRNFVRAPR